MTDALIPRTTVAEIVGQRDRALEIYDKALVAIHLAHEHMRIARQAVDAACGGGSTGESYSSYVDQKRAEIEAFNAALGPRPDAHDFAEGARRLTDTRVWASLVERTNLDALMDKEAKEELRRQMGAPQERRRFHSAVARGDEESDELPHVTEENIRQTLEHFAGQAGTIFRRGLANAFASLDRRFRSHDGFKIGSRIILSRAFDEWGRWSHYRGSRDTLHDVERVFRVLDGQNPTAPYAGIVGMIDAERKGQFGGKQSEHEGDYFRVRIFKNGNAHLWFTRDDLVEKANRLLAEFYGDVLGEGREAAEDPTAPLENRAVGHARNLGWFPTPDAVVARVLERAEWRDCSVLEPSAGEGALADAVIREGALAVDCLELDADREAKLRASGLYRAVARADFLRCEPRACYDRVIMNPPFDRGRDIDHVWHAWKFLRPGGRLVAVMSASTEFREDRKAAAFRAEMNAAGARWTDLPAGSFAPATNVQTLILAVSKPGKS